MLALTAFQGKNIAVFGLGGSGFAVAQALVAGGANVSAWDDAGVRVKKAQDAGVPVLDLHDADWTALDSLVLSPGVPLTHPEPHWTVKHARAAGVEIIGDMELFARQRMAVAPFSPVVAITGTNGKSTTTALIAHLVNSAKRKVALGGNIGTPVLELPMPHAGVTHVLEVSSYQMDLAPGFNPTVGILLNLTEDHLDRHGTLENYAAIKERLVAQVEAKGTAIVGVDDRYCAAIADRLEQSGKKVERISVRHPVAQGIYAVGSKLYRAEGGAETLFVDLDGIGSLRGAHNAQNAAAAVLALLALGVGHADIVAGLRNFPGLAHRMEQVETRKGILFVNDSKATNADAAARALSSFQNIYWIAGGLPKTGGIDSLRDYFPKIAKAYLIGTATEEFAATLQAQAAFEACGTLDVAVARAYADALQSGKPDPVVLLSPACASFDQYPNFEVRGEAFRAAIKVLDT